MTSKNSNTVLRQLEFPVADYQEAEEIMAGENKRLGLVTRKEKINLKGFLPQLVADGIAFRKGEVYKQQNVEHTPIQSDAYIKACYALKEYTKLIS